MKKIYLTLILAAFALLSQAAIIHVDQNPNRPAGYYADIVVAANTASAGDTLYIHPSNNSYGTLTLTKKLHLFGFGYTGQVAGVSELDYLYLDTTSTPSSNPSGTTVQGLTINGFQVKKPNINNLKLYGNYFSNGAISLKSGCNNIEIRNNYIYSYISLDNATSVIISNNIFRGYNSSGVYYSNSATVVISNNMFLNWQYFYDVSNASVNNNIFICNGNANQSRMFSNTFTNNLSWRSAANPYTIPPTGNSGSGNVSNQDPLFETGTASGYFDYTLDYQLKSTSPGKNAGSDGTDIGPYGGTTPFEWGGGLTIPRVTELVIKNPMVNQGGTINIQVKAQKADL